jgi:hypothetical protein
MDDRQVQLAHYLAEWFWNLNEDVERDYAEGKISRKTRNELVKAIRESRNETMALNDPLKPLKDLIDKQ